MTCMMKRSPGIQQVSWGNTDTTSSAADIGLFAGGLFVPSFDTGDVTFTVCDTVDGTFVALYDDAGTAVTMTVGGGSRAVEIPEEVMLARYVKFVATNAASGAQTATLILKS